VSVFEFTLALGFGSEVALALREARAALARPAEALQREYVRGWNDYVGTLRGVRPGYAAQFTLAAMVLKAHEDKTARGAMIASLTKPWGDETDASEPTVGGYHLVWSRDLYHVATAFHALGDKGAADRALQYLFKVQQRADGSFPQNSWLDGRPFWPSLQLDEVAYPLILAHELGRTDGDTYLRHVQPAAEFILAHGPQTPQERWEEEGGFSPSTLAAEIAGLAAAAAIAEMNADRPASERYRAAARDWASKVESWTVTRSGPLAAQPYFIRLSQQGRPDSGQPLEINNGGPTLDERAVADAGFLELVRLGLRPPGDPLVAASLAIVDRELRVQTPHGPAFYRYSRDGYGEKPDGRGYDGTGLGRLWALLAGERGEYELANGRDATAYLEAMLGFANEGGMLPEQVWDRSDSPRPHLRFGEGTGSATPLAWSCAQFIRLALGIEDGRVVGQPSAARKLFLER
jgi:glucoamylase